MTRRLTLLGALVGALALFALSGAAEAGGRYHHRSCHGHHQHHRAHHHHHRHHRHHDNHGYRHRYDGHRVHRTHYRPSYSFRGHYDYAPRYRVRSYGGCYGY